LDSLPVDPQPDSSALPSQKIRFDVDIELWKRTSGYQDYMIFLRRLSDAVTGVNLPQQASDPGKVGS
jgi:serine/threonine-protein phosphatase 2A activator